MNMHNEAHHVHDEEDASSELRVVEVNQLVVESTERGVDVALAGEEARRVPLDGHEEQLLEHIDNQTAHGLLVLNAAHECEANVAR